MRVVGGSNRAARLVGLPVNLLALAACALGGAAAGLAGMFEVAAVQGSANASLLAGYGYAGILVAFAARQNPLAIIVCALMIGGIEASGSLLQRRLDLPDATTLVLQGLLFANLLAWEALGGRIAAWRVQLQAAGYRRCSLVDGEDPCLTRTRPFVDPAAFAGCRRDPRQHAVSVREPGRMPDRKGRPRKSRSRGHSRLGRDERLCRRRF